MTKEEAIELIKHIGIAFVPTDQYGDYDDPEPYEEAIDMAIEALSAEAEQTIRHIENNTKESDLVYRPSAKAVPIHEDGTLEVKVPNAQKVGRVLVMDTDSHIGGGLFYPESAEAVQGWIPCSERLPSEDGCYLVCMNFKYGNIEGLKNDAQQIVAKSCKISCRTAPEKKPSIRVQFPDGNKVTFYQTLEGVSPAIVWSEQWLPFNT